MVLRVVCHDKNNVGGDGFQEIYKKNCCKEKLIKTDFLFTVHVALVWLSEYILRVTCPNGECSQNEVSNPVELKLITLT